MTCMHVSKRVRSCNAIWVYRKSAAAASDREVTLIGSANMDRRSFELNYENNILFYDRSLTGIRRQGQESYSAHSRAVSGDLVQRWTWRQRLWNNAIAMLGPVL